MCYKARKARRGPREAPTRHTIHGARARARARGEKAALPRCLGHAPLLGIYLLYDPSTDIPRSTKYANLRHGAKMLVSGLSTLPPPPSSKPFTGTLLKEKEGDAEGSMSEWVPATPPDPIAMPSFSALFLLRKKKNEKKEGLSNRGSSAVGVRIV
ncbi:hypothetical protein LZ31DRAFT_102114 [Colletotrichum somersetense]|nr:hypothetical protein LZ31DRAFT_102114 [Colletotrichum somersetense]